MSSFHNWKGQKDHLNTSSPSKLIIHIDMDAFFASCEQRDFPHLRGKPVAVGGSPNGRGVVAAASYEARKFGVQSAMPSSTAKKQCPHLIFVKHRFDVYKEASQKVMAILNSITPLVQPLSIDEAFIDATRNSLKENDGRKLAMYIKDRIYKATQLTASVGVAPVKFVAKMASDYNKPNGLCVVSPDEVYDFLSPLAVGLIPGVGKKMQDKLKLIRVKTIEDLRRFDRGELRTRFGKFGDLLYDRARGFDERKVHVGGKAKSIGSERTFKDLTDLQELLHILQKIVRETCDRLERKKTFGKTLILKVRYDDFTTITRSQTFQSRLQKYEDIYPVAEKIVLEQSEMGSRPIRLLGATMTQLERSSDPEQLEIPLF